MESSKESFPSVCPGAGDTGRHQGNAARGRTSAPRSGGPPRGASRSGSDSSLEWPPPPLLESVSGFDDDPLSGDGDGRAGRGRDDASMPPNHANSDVEENEERSSEDNDEDREGTERMRIKTHWCLLCASMLRLLLYVSLTT